MSKSTKAKRKLCVANKSEIEEAEKKIERLELLSTAQDLELLSTQLSALKIKLQQLQAEANVVQRDITDIQAKGQKMMQDHTSRLVDFKKKHNVPEDKEIDLRTGELVDPPSQKATAK
jgi:hypothetical protein